MAVSVMTSKQTAICAAALVMMACTPEVLGRALVSQAPTLVTRSLKQAPGQVRSLNHALRQVMLGPYPFVLLLLGRGGSVCARGIVCFLQWLCGATGRHAVL